MKSRQLMALGLTVMLSVSGMGTGTGVYAESAQEEQMNAAAEAQATEPPATEPPATEPPATEPPATEPPATEPPATEPPATEPPVTEAPVTEAPSEAPVTEAPTDTGTDSSESTEAATDIPITESEAAGTETETGSSETAPETETDTETETDELIEDEETETETERHITNEQLIARQNIVTPPDISLEFRFTQTDKVYAVVKNPEGASVYEERSAEEGCVGRLEYYGLCYILADEGQDWLYVESGNVRGFIRAENVVVGETAERLVKVRGEENLPLASLTMARSRNSAYTYTHTTVYPVIAPKVYAVARGKVNIHEARQASSRVTGTMLEGYLCYILADEDSDWVYVESGNARGFVQAAKLRTGSEAADIVSTLGENNMLTADVLVEPEDNSACYYTLTSVKEANQAALLRSEMVNFSFRFLGNPYVWGGTSLTNGCDCSGFTQSIYANFGYSIPRVAEAQAVYGMQIPVSSAAPGDLIFYAKNGYVYHVSMYIGNGQVIHAAGKSTGIIISGIGSAAVWATRIIQD